MAQVKLAEDYMNVSHAAKRAGISRSAMYQAIQAGRLPHTKIAGITTVVSVEDVDAFIERRKRQEPTAPATSAPYTLEELVAQITDENRHAEADFGPAVGNEIW